MIGYFDLEFFFIYNGSFWYENFYRFQAIVPTVLIKTFLTEAMAVTIAVTWFKHHWLTAHATNYSYHFLTSLC